jgi:hypothetical protein
MVSHYRCQNEQRLQAARYQPGVDGQYLNGIDYLEVATEQNTIRVHLLHELSSTQVFTPDNIQILRLSASESSLVPCLDGIVLNSLNGNREVIPVSAVSSSGQCITIKLQSESDRASLCLLRLVQSALELRYFGKVSPAEQPPPLGFDPQLSRILFSLRPEGSSEVDCEPLILAAAKTTALPIIDYLAKDYASFRRLMLDRLTLTMPEWRERSPADIGIMLVELLAYKADHLSYYQDAIATEAYLGTARKRVSVRRHARLLDYFLYEGCNARAWVTVRVTAPTTSQDFNPKTDGILLSGPSPTLNRAGTQMLTQVQGLLPLINLNMLRDRDRLRIQDAIRNAEVQVFETVEDVTLYEPCNEICFYTWGQEENTLPAGSTRATLKDTGGKLQQCLSSRMVLILEEYRHPDTGNQSAADPTHRHAVRLMNVTPREDPLIAEAGNPKQKQRVVEIEWFAEDALPFDLCLSKRINGKLYPDMSVIRGNVVLVDHGQTYPDQFAIAHQSIQPLEIQKSEVNRNPDFLDETKLNQVTQRDRYRPYLKHGPLTQQQYILNQNGKWILIDRTKPARAVFEWQTRDVYSGIAAKEYKAQEATRTNLDQKLREVRPCISLKEYNAQESVWRYEPDLLNSERFARNFVVETEDDGRAYLRFGDNQLGKRPEVGTYFKVTYRVGNGSVGNVGAEAIAHIVTNTDRIQSVRNPLPAQGGSEPESLDQVRLYAPHAFRVQQRAVTEADYAEIAQRHPEVQRAIANRRWTGSWYTIFLTIDRQGGRPLDETFKKELSRFLERFRMAGHDLKIEEPRFVPLHLAMKVIVSPGYFRNSVKQALLEAFSNRVLANGQSGFFAPDRLTFGQTIYLSQTIKTAVQVEGVLSVEVNRFQRWGKPSQGELKTGQIAFDVLEIAQLNNDPANPNQGQIEFEMEGGL